MRFVISILSGTAAAIVAALPLAWFGSGLHPWSAWIALLCGLAVSVVIFPEPQSPGIHSPSTFSEWVMIAVFTIASFRAFSMLIYSEGDAWKVLSPNNLGDLSLHLSLIRWLAATPHWWPASPILAGDPLRYPPGSDLFDALLLSVGVPVEAGLIFCGMAGAALAGIALWRWGGAVAVAAFLFNGGFAGWALITGGWGVDLDHPVEKPLSDALCDPTRVSFRLARRPAASHLLEGRILQFLGKSSPPAVRQGTASLWHAALQRPCCTFSRIDDGGAVFASAERESKRT